MKEINEFDVLLRVVEVIEKKITLQQNIVSPETKQQIEIGIEKIDIIINNKQMMGDNIEINKSQIGAVGSNATSTGNSFNQQIIDLPAETDYEVLEKQITLLKENLIKDASSADHFKAIAEIALAEEMSKSKNGKGIVNHLVNGGKWVLDKAQEIGVELVAEIIKKQMGI